jgi:hypothetical protein
MTEVQHEINEINSIVELTHLLLHTQVIKSR